MKALYTYYHYSTYCLERGQKQQPGLADWNFTVFSTVLLYFSCQVIFILSFNFSIRTVIIRSDQTYISPKEINRAQLAF